MKVSALLPLVIVCALGCSKGADTAGGTPAAPAAPSGKYVAVQAVFTANCIRCHSGPRPKAGIDLSSYDGVMKGSMEGPIVAAGDPANSKIIRALHGQGARPMPPRGSLGASDITTIEDWIKAGAKNG